MTWASLTPSERGDIRARIHRYLRTYGEVSATGVMHGASLPIDTVTSALGEMTKSGAVTVSGDRPPLYRAVAQRTG